MIDRTETQGVSDQKQRAQLETILKRAERIREHAAALQAREGHRVYFRPTTTGVDMLSLADERPLQGRVNIKNLAAVVADFEAEYQRWCVAAPAERVSAEKRLQAWLIRHALPQGRSLTQLGALLGAPLRFVTDDLPVPYMGKRLASDLLALQGAQPVVLEVCRARGAGLERVHAYASVMERHPEHYSKIYSALLGEPVTLEPRDRKSVV